MELFLPDCQAGTNVSSIETRFRQKYQCFLLYTDALCAFCIRFLTHLYKPAVFPPCSAVIYKHRFQQSATIPVPSNLLYVQHSDHRKEPERVPRDTSPAFKTGARSDKSMIRILPEALMKQTLCFFNAINKSTFSAAGNSRSLHYCSALKSGSSTSAYSSNISSRYVFQWRAS